MVVAWQPCHPSGRLDVVARKASSWWPAEVSWTAPLAELVEKFATADGILLLRVLGIETPFGAIRELFDRCAETPALGERLNKV